MHTAAALLDLHDHAHRSLTALLEHCAALEAEDLVRPLAGFGYPTVREQLHHVIGAEQYWIGVLQGRVEVDEDPGAYPDIAALAAYRQRVAAATADHLRRTTDADLTATCRRLTWNGTWRDLVPAHVVLRVITHLFHHQGQLAAMCRLLGRPVGGLDYPLT